MCERRGAIRLGVLLAQPRWPVRHVLGLQLLMPVDPMGLADPNEGVARCSHRLHREGTHGRRGLDVRGTVVTGRQTGRQRSLGGPTPATSRAAL
jgi:hypothetical protein